MKFQLKTINNLTKPFIKHLSTGSTLPKVKMKFRLVSSPSQIHNYKGKQQNENTKQQYIDNEQVIHHYSTLYAATTNCKAQIYLLCNYNYDNCAFQQDCCLNVKIVPLSLVREWLWRKKKKEKVYCHESCEQANEQKKVFLKISKKNFSHDCKKKRENENERLQQHTEA